MSKKLEIETKLRAVAGHKFEAEFDDPRYAKLVVDEPEPLGTGEGPNPVRLLSVAVGHCMSSSLVYCLDKARVKVEGMETRVKMDLVKCEQGYWRIEGIGVKIFLEVKKEDRGKVPRCLTLFEEYCTVTQGLRLGSRVVVGVELGSASGESRSFE
jgi:uncharacterized OsmC-like protein